MRRLLSITHRSLRRLLIGLLALLALANGLAFLLTPLLDHYRDELTDYASARLGVPLSVAGLQARWHGFGPEVVLQDLRIGAPDQPGSIRLADAAVDLGLWDMLRHWDLSPLRVTLRHLEIHLIRDSEGKLQLAGFEGLQNGASGAGSEESAAGIAALPLSGRLRLEDVTVLWEDQRLKLPVRRLEHAQLRLRLWPNELVLAASVQLPGRHPGVIRAAAELALNGQDWDGQAYLLADLPEAAEQLGPYLPEGLRVTRGGIGMEVWSDWQASRLSAMEGRLGLEDLHLDRGPETPALEIDSAKTDFRYRRDGEQRHIQLSGLTVRRAGHKWPASDIYVKLDLSQEGLPELQLAADRLRLDDLLAMTRPAPLPAELAELRDGLAADAMLQDVRFRLEPGAGPARWQLSTAYSGLQTRAWRHYPGVHGLEGRLQGDQRQLAIQLAGNYTQLDLPTLLRAPLPVRELQAGLHLQKLGEGWQLHSDQLILNTPDIDTRSRLTLSQAAGGDLQIDLQTNFGNGESSFAERYYPVHIMKPELVDWLDRAIGSGLVPRGTLLLQGPLRDFPFDKTHTGHFEVRFDVADLQLAFLPEWPALTVQKAEVRFHNNSMAIRLQRGRIYDSDVLSAEAHIRSLHPTLPLEIKGTVQGPLADPLRLLAESPLKARFGKLAGDLRARGTSRLALDFAVKLDQRVGEDRLAGTLDLQRSGLELPEWQLALSEAEGRLSFDLDGVQAKDIRAKALGRPVSIDVSPAADGALVHASTHIDIPTLQARFPELASQLPAKRVSGDADVAIEVDIRRAPGPGRRQTLRVSSDLVGIRADLPAPLGKTAEQARPLVLTIPLDEGGESYQLSYDKLLSVAFQPGADRLGIHFGEQAAELPDQDVLKVTGRIEQLELDPWLSLGSSGEQGRQGAGGKTLPPLRADITVGRLGLRQTQLADVRLVLDQQPDSWQGKLQAEDIAGVFDIPASPGERPIRLDLDRLRLTLAPDDAGSAKPTADSDPGRPADWPELNLNIAELLINQESFGQLTLEARHSQQGLDVSPLRIHGPLLNFDGEAHWHGTADTSRTHFSGSLQAPQLGKVLTALGYSAQFSGAQTEANFDLNWPGNPASFEVAGVEGSLELAIEEGQLLEVDPGVARVFGLLNFRALQRRLRLDFSDLFKQGLAFDAITGRFHLVDGNAYTRNLKIKAPSGTIVITGRTGLVKHDLYQEITVDPRLDATLPVAGALAAGPWAGVAVLVAQTLMKDRVEKVQRVQYRVSGSWEDPKVEQISGGGLSSLFKPDEAPAQTAPESKP